MAAIAGARGTSDKCSAHGGGKRCQEDGCNSGARGTSDKCSAHGGGKRCQEDGCNSGAVKVHQTSAQHMVVGKDAKKMAATACAASPSDKCIKHGGGKRCQEDGCNSSAQGKTNKCAYHGGGIRCAGINCQGGHCVAKKGDLCAFCSPAKEGKYSKKKENVIVDLLTKNDIKFDGETTIKYCNIEDNKQYARLDFVIEYETHRSILSVDENSHNGNPVSCEVSRMTKVMESIALADRSRPTTWIRYNPDTYRVNKIIQKVSDKKRHERLLELIKTVPKCDFEVRYLYYNVDKNNVLELFSDAEYSDQFKKFVVSVK